MRALGGRAVFGAQSGASFTRFLAISQPISRIYTHFTPISQPFITHFSAVFCSHFSGCEMSQVPVGEAAWGARAFVHLEPWIVQLNIPVRKKEL